MDSTLPSPESERRKAFQELNDLADQVKIANDLGNPAQKAYLLGKIVGICIQYMDDEILDSDSAHRIITWTIQEREEDDILQNGCPHLRKDAKGFYCGSGRRWDERYKKSSDRRMLCDMASIDLWCRDRERCHLCIAYDNPQFLDLHTQDFVEDSPLS